MRDTGDFLNIRELHRMLAIYLGRLEADRAIAILRHWAEHSAYHCDIFPNEIADCINSIFGDSLPIFSHRDFD